MSAGKAILLIFGVIVVLVSAGLGFAGGTLVWLDRTHVDDQGFVSSSPIHMERGSYAIVIGPIETDEVAVNVLKWIGVANTFVVEGSTRDSARQIFMGVAEDSDLKAYLGGVEYDDPAFRGWPFPSLKIVTYSKHAGVSEPAAPVTQSFWSESVHGPGTQILEWDTSAGSHDLVLMNGDGSAGLDLNVTFKVKAPGALLPIGIAILVGGTIGILLGGLMIFRAVRW